MTGPVHTDPLPTRAELAGAYAVVAFVGSEARVWAADGLNGEALGRALRDLADIYDTPHADPVNWRSDRDNPGPPPPTIRVGDFWNGVPVTADMLHMLCRNCGHDHWHTDVVGCIVVGCRCRTWDAPAAHEPAGASTEGDGGVSSRHMTPDPHTTPDDVDTGTLLHVPEDQRLDVDPGDEPNDDAGIDLSDVPDGEVAALSTAGLDEGEL